jgi:hypothetical protein
MEDIGIPQPHMRVLHMYPAETSHPILLPTVVTIKSY